MKEVRMFFLDKLIENNAYDILGHHLMTYTVELLTTYAVQPNNNNLTLYDLYEKALSLNGIDRFLAFKRLGDTSLFVAGVFKDYVQIRNTGIQYYIDIGSTAYSSIANNKDIYTDLSNKFETIVGIVNQTNVIKPLNDSILSIQN